MPDLHYYLGDTLARLERYPEAERELTMEIRMFPSNLRARAARAMLYRAQGRTAESDREIEDIIHTSPGPEGYGLAVKLYTMFGETEKAQAATGDAPARPGQADTGRALTLCERHHLDGHQHAGNRVARGAPRRSRLPPPRRARGAGSGQPC